MNNNTKNVRFPIVIEEPVTEHYTVEEIKTRNAHFTKAYKVVGNFSDSTVTLEDYKYFSPNAEKIINYFGEDIVVQAIKGLKMGDITQIQKVPEDFAYRLASPEVHSGLIVSDIFTYEATEYKGTWERKVDRVGFEVAMHTQYYSVYESNLLTKCFLLKWPFVKEFDFKAYCLGGGRSTDEIYIYLTDADGNKMCAYVPYQCFVERNAYYCIERTSKASLNGDKDKIRAFLDSPETQKLFEYIVNPETYVNNSQEAEEYEVKKRYEQHKYLLIEGTIDEVKEPMVFNTFTEAYEALEEIEDEEEARGGIFTIERNVRYGEATAQCALTNGEVLNFRIFRVKTSKF